MGRSTRKKQPSIEHAVGRQGAPVAATGNRNVVGNQGSPTGERRPAFNTLLVCLALVLLTLSVFAQTLRFDFVDFDDLTYLAKNRHVAHGFATPGAVTWALTSFYADNWHPLTWFSHLLDCQLYGLTNPGGHHATNAAIHAVNAVLLFLLLRRMTGGFWASAFVAAMFAVHPLRAESVAWVSERKDVLSGLFFILTLAAYARYACRPFSPIRYLMMIAVFALGLLTKPMLVTVPFLLLLIDYWPLQRWPAAGDANRWQRGWRLILEKTPMLLLALVSCIVTILAQRSAIVPTVRIALTSRMANAAVAYAEYLRQSFFPWDLAAFYPHPRQGWPIWAIAAAVFLLATVSLAAIWRRRRMPYLFVGWFWYLGMLVPVIGLMQVGIQAKADRYTYLPQIGLCIAVTWSCSELLCRFRHRRVACGALAATVVLALACAAWRQTSFWHDSETLWTRALVVADSATAHTNLGRVLHARGQTDAAARHYRKAIECDPFCYPAYNNLGVLLGKDDLDAAMRCFLKAIDGKYDYVEAYYNMGAAQAEHGDAANAVVAFKKAAELDPSSVEIRSALADALCAAGHFENGIAEFEEALRIDPSNVEVLFKLGMRSEARDADSATGYYNRVLALAPKHAGALNDLGSQCGNRGEFDHAVRYFRAALEAEGDDPTTQANLAAALEQQRFWGQALAQSREAVRRQPNSVEALNQLAWLLATSADTAVRNGAEAMQLARQAVELSGGQEPAVLDTLAAAYAEAGQFPDAIQTAHQALDLARRQGKHSLGESIRAKLAVYQSKSPIRQRPAKPAK